MFIAFGRAEHEGAFFVTTPFERGISAGIMLLAFFFLSAALLRQPRVLLTGETVLAQKGAITGVLRLTRHPFLWALVLWAGVHAFNNADPAGLSLFGYFFVLALFGTWPIDRRRARLLGDERWQEIVRQTSNLPLVAVLRGDQKPGLALREIGWRAPLVALAAWGFMLTFHQQIIGLPVFY